MQLHSKAQDVVECDFLFRTVKRKAVKGQTWENEVRYDYSEDSDAVSMRIVSAD